MNSDASADSSSSAFEDFLAGKPDPAASGSTAPAVIVPPAPEDAASHRQIIANLRAELERQLRAETLAVLPAGMTVRARGNVGEFAYRPDLVVDVDLPPTGVDSARQPLVIFEVAAAGSERAAFIEGWQIHQSLPSVGVYVWVDTAQVGATLYRRTGDGWKTEVLEDADEQIFLPTIHALLSLETVYTGVFPEEED